MREANAKLEEQLLKELREQFGVDLDRVADFKDAHLDKMAEHVMGKAMPGGKLGFGLGLGMQELLALKPLIDKGDKAELTKNLDNKFHWVKAMFGKMGLERLSEGIISSARAATPGSTGIGAAGTPNLMLKTTDICVAKNNQIDFGCGCRSNNTCFKMGKEFVPKEYRKHQEVKDMARLVERITHGGVDSEKDSAGDMMRTAFDYGKKVQTINNKLLAKMGKAMKKSKNKKARNGYIKAMKHFPEMQDKIWKDYLQLDNYPENNHLFLGNVLNYNKAIKRALVSRGRGRELASFLPNFKSMGSGMVDSMFDFEGGTGGAAIGGGGAAIFRNLEENKGRLSQDEIIDGLKDAAPGSRARRVMGVGPTASVGVDAREAVDIDQYEVDSVSKKKSGNIFGIISRRYLMKHKKLQ